MQWERHFQRGRSKIRKKAFGDLGCVWKDCVLVPIAGHLKNDFYEIFALICYQFFQMPFQYLSTELYEIIVSPTAKGMTIWQLETDISGADEMR